MRLLIEKYQYPPSVLDELGIPEDWRFRYTNGQESINKVGYYRSSLSDKKREPIFIIPKIFEKGGKVFEEIDILDFAKHNIPDVFKAYPHKKNHLEWLYRFSLLLYISLRNYRQRNKETSLSDKTHFQNIVANTPDDQTSELELVLNILEFYRNNHDLIVFTEKQNQSQHFRKTNWAKTIRTQQPFFTENQEPVYLNTVTKQRHQNNDDELLKIFYSVLRHFKKEYGFRIEIQTSYDIITKIDDPSVSRQLARTLKGLKNVYFADRFRKLLNLLLLYFQRQSEARTQQGGKEYLLCHDYHHVFEDMVDALLSDENMENNLKNQADGKIVDHLFNHKSLFMPDDIWYIGDSKYYKEDSSGKTDLGKVSIYKQHTYAKNIIQYNINLFNGKNREKIKGRYRDELTEGYNVSPNFFIQAMIYHEDLFKKEAEFQFDETEEAFLNFHFNNRLFDRDTLSVHHFQINFLYVLQSYIHQNMTEKRLFKEEAMKTIREKVVAFYNNKYTFYEVDFEDATAIDNFIKQHFKVLNGKVYRTSQQEKSLWLALENKEIYQQENELIKSFFSPNSLKVKLLC